MLPSDNHPQNLEETPAAAENALAETPADEKELGKSSATQKDDHYRELFFYRNLVKENPNNLNYRYDIAKILISLNDHENAIAHLRIALDQDPGFTKARILIGDCYVETGYRDRALTEFANAATNDDLEGIKKAYELTFIDRDYVESIKLAEKLIKLEPKNKINRRNLAMCYYMLGEFKKSHDAISKNIKDKNPESDDYAQYSLALNRLNKYAPAAEAMEKACEMDPENHVHAVNLANIYITLKRIEEAEKKYQEALNLNPKSTVAWFNLGELQLKHGKTGEAVKAFDKVVSLDADDAEAWMHLARAKLEKSPEQALRALQKAKSLNLKKDEVRYVQAEILERLGRFKEALPVRLGIFKDFLHNKENIYNLIKLHIRTGSPQEAVSLISYINNIQQSDVRFFMAYSSYLRFEGRTKEELGCLELILKCDGEFLPAKERIYDIAFEGGHYSRAFELGKKMKVHRVQNFRKMYVMIGHLLFIDDVNHASAEVSRLLEFAKYIPGFWAKIIQLFKRYNQVDELLSIIYHFTLESNPDTFSVIGMCKALDEAGYPADVEKLCRQRMQSDSDNPHMMNLLGSLLVRQNRANEAITLLKEYNIRQRSDEIDITLGEAYMKLGEIEHARDYFESVLAKNKSHYQALFCMGLTANKSGDREQAIAFFNQSLESQSGDYRVWFNYGLLKFKAGEEESGIEDVCTALKLAPRNPQILSTLGTLYLKTGNHPRAKYNFLKSLAVDPNGLKVWNNLSVLFEENGEIEKAEYCNKQSLPEENPAPKPKKRNAKK